MEQNANATNRAMSDHPGFEILRHVLLSIG